MSTQTTKESQLSQQATSSNDSFIQRCPHDAENPYAQISRDLLRDKNISFKARGFLAYCLSFDKTWKFHFPQIAKEHGIGRDQIYTIIEELIEVGYAKKEVYLQNNLKRVKFVFSESPKFKKCFRHPGFQDPEASEPGKTDYKKSNLSSSLQSEDRKEKQSNKRSEIPPPSADASELFDHFLKKIKERKPDFKEPPKVKWIAEFDKMLRIDKRDKQKTMELITWITEGRSFPYIMSPKALRDKYDQQQAFYLDSLEAQKKTPNQKTFYETKAKYPKLFKSIKIKSYGIVDEDTGRDAGWDLPEKTFANILAGMIGGRVHGD